LRRRVDLVAAAPVAVAVGVPTARSRSALVRRGQRRRAHAHRAPGCAGPARYRLRAGA